METFSCSPSLSQGFTGRKKNAARLSSTSFYSALQKKKTCPSDGPLYFSSEWSDDLLRPPPSSTYRAANNFKRTTANVAFRTMGFGKSNPGSQFRFRMTSTGPFVFELRSPGPLVFELASRGPFVTNLDDTCRKGKRNFEVLWQRPPPRVGVLKCIMKMTTFRMK